MTDDKKEQPYKAVKFRADKHTEIAERTTALADERGSNLSMADYLSEASKFFETHRKNPHLGTSE